MKAILYLGSGIVGTGHHWYWTGQSNITMALMVLLNLFPGGIVQLRDVLENGYWHARSLDFIGQPLMRTLEWLRLPGDIVFILVGVLPAVLAAVTGWRFRNESAGATANK